MNLLLKTFGIRKCVQRIKIYQTKSLKFSYFHNFGLEPLKATTLGSVLETSSRKHPDTLAFVLKQQKKQITYGELLTQSDKLAAGFRTLGLEYGDRIGLWAPNILEWMVVKMAAARAGLILVPLNPVYEAPEMKYSINKVGIKALVCPDVAKRMNYYEILNTIFGDLPNSEPSKLNCKDMPSLKSIITISDNTLKGTYNYNEVMEMGDDKTINDIRANQHRIQPDDPCCIQFSSGTTGQPKATVLSHFHMVNNGYFIGKRLELNKKRHTACMQVPFFHVYGDVAVIGALLHHEMTAVVPATFYSPEENLRALQDDSCSFIFGTPTMYVDLVHLQTQRNLNINPEFALTGGALCSPSLFAQMKSVLKVKTLKTIYGLTETTAVCFQSLIGQDESKTFSWVGHVHEHVEVKVVDEKNKIVPFGTPGELCVRGYCNMLEYWDDPKKTKETIGADRWLRTGDQFILEEDGYGKVVGRLKDMLIRGGENIFPKEIEEYLNTHPDILETYVIGLPHERLGEEVCACVRVREGSNLNLESMREYCKGKLAKFKIPTVLKIMDRFPRTQSGKIQKFILQKKFSAS